MKEAELRQKSICKLCKRKLGQTKLPLFFLIKVERHGLKMDSIRRQSALAGVLGGNGVLAQVMGPDEDVTELLDTTESVICEECCQTNPVLYSLFFGEYPNGN